MIIEKIPQENITQFATELEKIVRSATNKRGYSFKLSVTSNKTAVIEIIYSGLKGNNTSQSFMLIHDNLDGWVAYYNSTKITLTNLRELTQLTNKISRKLQALAKRF